MSGQYTDNDDTSLKGATDGTPIGNVADALKTSATLSSITDTGKGREYTGYSPDPSSTPGIVSEVSLDYSDQTMIRGQVLTDEGSFRDDFSGSSLTTALSGSAQFNGSVSVGGTGGSSFTTEVKSGQYIKKTSDPETSYRQVDYVAADNQLYLTTAYPSSGTASAVVSNWKTTTPVGGSITVGSSLLSLAPGTANGAVVGIERAGDYLPYTFVGRMSISQRIANQTIVFGFRDTPTSPTKQACFVFDGTSATTVKCRTSYSSAAADIEETTVSIPVGDTSTQHNYKIDLSPTICTFSIDNVIIARHTVHLPGPYDSLGLVANVTNAAAVTATTVAIDYVFFQNLDQVEVTTSFLGEPLAVVQSTKPATYSASAISVSSANNATDIFTITGSATKLIKILKMEVSATQTTGGAGLIQLVKRSTANTGGTSATATAVPNDSSSAAATATVRSYTVNPTVGTAVGTVRAERTLIPSTTVAEQPIDWIFGDQGQQPITLRSAAEVLAVNLNSVTFTGGNWTFYVEWTEE